MFRRLTFPLLPILLIGLISPVGLLSQSNVNQNPFRQLGQELPTPNMYRNAAGAPGHGYWQQKADYTMDIRLDDDAQKIFGEATITYHNESPDALSYLWLQLDQNMRAKDSDAYKTETIDLEADKMKLSTLKRVHDRLQFDGGFHIDFVKDETGNPLPYTINKTMMRVDLPSQLASGSSYSFQVKWWYNINDRIKIKGRSGYEYFDTDGNYLYTIAQFYPRMAMYSEVEGWQHKQFLGDGEFTLSFGDYEVSLTVPSDHVVAATGTLQNADNILSRAQKSRLEKANEALEQPVMIVTAEEARLAEKKPRTDMKTWVFAAENVRDFAFATSRKFLWDAMAVKFGDRTVLAMSYYPKEGNPLWGQYSTKSVAHTLKVYSRYTFDYPYPVAISVHTANIGMEYPMICFNGYRPESDGTYTERSKYGLISVVIHEVGHNYFPMIVNSDERQWTWMDEGLNSFPPPPPLQYLTEQEWELGYPSRRGPAPNIVDYMAGDKSRISPIMTNSESIHQFGNNAYGKPAAALNILRETIMGRELFDFAFKTYSQRWMFRHPEPADFFRTMEDASGVDLDWFWRGWFYTNDHVDLAIEEVKWFQLDTRNPEKEKPIAKAAEVNAPPYVSDLRNKETISQTYLQADPALADFYDRDDPFKVTLIDRSTYREYTHSLTQEQIDFLNSGLNMFQIRFRNIGGLVMPLILDVTYEDGTVEQLYIPAEIWRYNPKEVHKLLFSERKITSIELDPRQETADTDRYNNYWPPRVQPTRFRLFKEKESEENPMQRQKREQEMSKEQSRGSSKSP